MHSAARCLLFFALTLGCGSGNENSEAKSPDREGRAQVVEEYRSNGSIPKRCARGKKYKKRCLPPPGWVRRLCEDVYPDVALHMFKPGTPWKRLYMVARAEPFNASGGASLLGDKLERGEEVLALRRRDNTSGLQVGDTAGYDVLRWNGACATIHDGDFVEEPPKHVVHSRIDWRSLSLPLRQALEAKPNIAEAYEARRKACKGQNLGIVAENCEENDRLLMKEIVRTVRTGARLPPAAKMP